MPCKTRGEVRLEMYDNIYVSVQLNLWCVWHRVVAVDFQQENVSTLLATISWRKFYTIDFARFLAGVNKAG
jgi:hypothetical protein